MTNFVTIRKMLAVGTAVLMLAGAGCKKEDNAAPKKDTKPDSKGAGDKGGGTPDKMTAGGDKGTGAGADKGTAAGGGDKGTAPAVAGDGLKIVEKVMQQGETMSEVEDMEMHMTLKVKGQSMDINQMEHKKSKEEVQAAGADSITKVKITYDEMTASEDKPGQPPGAPKPMAVAGKSYVVEAKGADLTVTDDKGAAAPDAEADIVKKDVKDHIGKADAFAAVIATMSFKVGEKQTIPADKIAGLMGADDNPNMKMGDFSITLTKNDGGSASFDCTIEMNIDQGPMGINIPLKGTITVDVASGHMTEMTFEGPVNVKGSDPSMPIEGSGSMKLHGTKSYGK
jgi:hypothetical protein